ncbi:MAG: hypothetical protein JWQ89_2752 [Devosia sp.]|nr:hypothetical protein [Devosia sp.]
MLPVITSQLDVQGNLRNNGCKGMLSTVRLPTAQLDVLSLLLQVFADHLLQDKSAEEVKARLQ